jgi:hypothetical protein
MMPLTADPSHSAESAGGAHDGLSPSVTLKDRRRGIRLTTVVVSLIALAFYVGFIVMMVLRAVHQ